MNATNSMTRAEFISIMLSAAALNAGFKGTQKPMKYELKPLPYPYGALEPAIDAETVKIHHDKHQAAYVANLNAALERAPLFSPPESLADLISNLDKVPAEIREAVKNNGGGVWNHEFYWSGLSPEKTEPSQALKAAAQKYFGSFDEMKAKLADASVKRFGSGWSWLIKAADGSLKIVSTPNQDCPLMAKDGSKPLLCIDVWEHAYYLKYKNMRASYVAAILDIVNWAKVSAEYES